MAKKIKKKAKRKTPPKRLKKMVKAGAPENKMVTKPPTLPTGQVVGKAGMSEKIDFEKEFGQTNNQGSNNGESDAQKI